MEETSQLEETSYSSLNINFIKKYEIDNKNKYFQSFELNKIFFDKNRHTISEAFIAPWKGNYYVYHFDSFTGTSTQLHGNKEGEHVTRCPIILKGDRESSIPMFSYLSACTTKEKKDTGNAFKIISEAEPHLHMPIEITPEENIEIYVHQILELENRKYLKLVINKKTQKLVCWIKPDQYTIIENAGNPSNSFYKKTILHAWQEKMKIFVMVLMPPQELAQHEADGYLWELTIDQDSLSYDPDHDWLNLPDIQLNPLSNKIYNILSIDPIHLLYLKGNNWMPQQNLGPVFWDFTKQKSISLWRCDREGYPISMILPLSATTKKQRPTSFVSSALPFLRILPHHLYSPPPACALAYQPRPVVDFFNTKGELIHTWIPKLEPQESIEEIYFARWKNQIYCFLGTLNALEETRSPNIYLYSISQIFDTKKSQSGLFMSELMAILPKKNTSKKRIKLEGPTINPSQCKKIKKK